MSAPTKILYSLANAAHAVDVSQKQLTRAIHAGELAAKKVGREYRIPAKALDAWAANLPDAE